MATRDEYRAQLLSLLPQGAAWPREGEGTLEALMDALAAEFERLDARAEVLAAEIDPRAASELLGAWEAAYGLPDGCVTAEPTPDGRRLALHQRVAALGGQSKPYFVGLAALLGYEAEIGTYRPSRVSFPLPRHIADVAWAFAWRVDVWGPVEMGDLTPVYASADLECVVQRIKPAHTVVSFEWAPEPNPTLDFDFVSGAPDPLLSFDFLQ